MVAVGTLVDLVCLVYLVHLVLKIDLFLPLNSSQEKYSDNIYSSLREKSIINVFSEYRKNSLFFQSSRCLRSLEFHR